VAVQVDAPPQDTLFKSPLPTWVPPNTAAAVPLYSPSFHAVQQVAVAMGAPVVPARHGAVHTTIPRREKSKDSLGALVHNLQLRYIRR